MTLKEERITYISQEKGTQHSTQDHKESTRLWSRGRSRSKGEGLRPEPLLGFPMGKAWQSSLGLAGLNSSSGL